MGPPPGAEKEDVSSVALTVLVGCSCCAAVAAAGVLLGCCWVLCWLLGSLLVPGLLVALVAGLLRFAQIYHDLPRFTTICRFQPCGFKAFPDPNSSTSAMECRDFLAANFNGDQLRTFFLQLMMHLATFKRMAWRTEFYNQWKDLHSGTGIS